MTELTRRFRAWMEEHESGDDPATPAATVLVLRDASDGPEILMVRRNAKGSFADHWVFPGGKLDPEDHADDPDDVIAASQRAAAREANEEADLVLDAGAFIPFSHWMPPTGIPRRFATWFFVAAAPEGEAGDVNIDGGEIVDHLWVRPSVALERHQAGEVELVPPTWVTLHDLADYATADEAIASIADEATPFYLTRMIGTEPRIVAWTGDAGWETGDVDAPGGRNRLTLEPGNWRLERSE